MIQAIFTVIKFVWQLLQSCMSVGDIQIPTGNVLQGDGSWLGSAWKTASGGSSGSGVMGLPIENYYENNLDPSTIPSPSSTAGNSSKAFASQSAQQAAATNLVNFYYGLSDYMPIINPVGDWMRWIAAGLGNLLYMVDKMLQALYVRMFSLLDLTSVQDQGSYLQTILHWGQEFGFAIAVFMLMFYAIGSILAVNASGFQRMKDIIWSIIVGATFVAVLPMATHMFAQGEQVFASNVLGSGYGDNVSTQPSSMSDALFWNNVYDVSHRVLLYPLVKIQVPNPSNPDAIMYQPNSEFYSPNQGSAQEEQNSDNSYNLGSDNKNETDADGNQQGNSGNFGGYLGSHSVANDQQKANWNTSDSALFASSAADGRIPNNPIEAKKVILNLSAMDPAEKDAWNGLQDTNVENFLDKYGTNSDVLNKGMLSQLEKQVVPDGGNSGSGSGSNSSNSKSSNNSSSKNSNKKSKPSNKHKSKKSIIMPHNLLMIMQPQQAHASIWNSIKNSKFGKAMHDLNNSNSGLAGRGTHMTPTEEKDTCGSNAPKAKRDSTICAKAKENNKAASALHKLYKSDDSSVFQASITGTGRTAAIQQLPAFNSGLGSSFTDAISDSYGKYKVNWADIYLGLVILAIVLTAFLFKLISTFFQAMIMYVCAGIMMGRVVTSPSSIKYYIRTYFGLYEMIIFDVIMVYMWFIGYQIIQATTTDIMYNNFPVAPNTIILGIIQGLLEIGLMSAVLDGVDAITHLLGQPTGAHDGWGKALLGLQAGRYLGGMGLAGARMLGRGASAAGGGIAKGHKAWKNHRAHKHIANGANKTRKPSKRKGPLARAKDAIRRRKRNMNAPHDLNGKPMLNHGDSKKRQQALKKAHANARRKNLGETGSSSDSGSGESASASDADNEASDSSNSANSSDVGHSNSAESKSQLYGLKHNQPTNHDTGHYKHSANNNQNPTTQDTKHSTDGSTPVNNTNSDSDSVPVHIVSGDNSSATSANSASANGSNNSATDADNSTGDNGSQTSLKNGASTSSGVRNSASNNANGVRSNSANPTKSNGVKSNVSNGINAENGDNSTSANVTSGSANSPVSNGVNSPSGDNANLNAPSASASEADNPVNPNDKTEDSTVNGSNGNGHQATQRINRRIHIKNNNGNNVLNRKVHDNVVSRTGNNGKPTVHTHYSSTLRHSGNGNAPQNFTGDAPVSSNVPNHLGSSGNNNQTGNLDKTVTSEGYTPSNDQRHTSYQHITDNQIEHTNGNNQNYINRHVTHNVTQQDDVTNHKPHVNQVDNTNFHYKHSIHNFTNDSLASGLGRQAHVDGNFAPKSGSINFAAIAKKHKHDHHDS